MVSDNLGEFSRPVESIMRCEDFKSNFARKLSNRYSRSISTKQDNILKLSDALEIDENAPERIECFQLSKSVIEQKEAEKPKQAMNMDHTKEMKSTEVNLLNMEVETLRWQLSQTEANRQMHIALLKQVVGFLNKVKEHIDCKKPEKSRKDLPGRKSPASFNVSDLPRSRSVLHVFKSEEYAVIAPKKTSSKKFSKSINNVYGFQDSNLAWNQSKLFLLSEIESKQKITEEITRLIVLANTVLSTKLPDLTCTASDTTEINEKNLKNKFNNITNAINVNPNPRHDADDTCNANINTSIDEKNTNVTSKTFDFEKDFSNLNIDATDTTKPLNVDDSPLLTEKPNEYFSPTFIEDESGFSSMSSFQEIGIPIISIIPPSPCKEVDYSDEAGDIFDANAWKDDEMNIDQQSVKVFWV